MSFRNLVLLRKLSTSLTYRRPSVSRDYKSKSLWNERLTCKILTEDANLIANINSKIISGESLNNLETDVFINIANPSATDTAQLEEALKLISGIRKTIEAHTILPSTHHALCRLFLYGQQIKTLVHVLDNRVKYGIFPDFFATNLILDEALQQNDYALGAKVASLVMLQEEFGLNRITDTLSAYSLAKYIESKPGFSEWSDIVNALEKNEETDSNRNKSSEEQKDGEEDDDEDDEDAEYIRVPFLRNPYDDNHFDLKDPRLICGKTFAALGRAFDQRDPDIAKTSTSIGQSLLDTTQENLDKVSLQAKQLGELLDERHSGFESDEQRDIEELRKSFLDWSQKRADTIARRVAIEERARLIEEIKTKEEELRLKEQYLYFYDRNKL